MSACPAGHLFCNECISRSTDSALGEGKAHFRCLEGECGTEFSLATLQEVVSSKTMSILLQKIQEEELRQAGIPDLVTCPFCSFATIMPDQEDKVFRCLNPTCLKESCRSVHWVNVNHVYGIPTQNIVKMWWLCHVRALLLCH